MLFDVPALQVRLANIMQRVSLFPQGQELFGL